MGEASRLTLLSTFAGNRRPGLTLPDRNDHSLIVVWSQNTSGLYPSTDAEKRRPRVVLPHEIVGITQAMRSETRHQLTTDIVSGVVYETVGLVPVSARSEAERMMATLADLAPRPVRFTKVKVTNDEGRNPDQQSVVQGIMDVSGAMVRAEAAGPTATDALRAIGDRLERRLSRLAGKRQRATRRPPSTPPGEWRSGDLPSDRPDFYDRPPEERMVVRRKTYSPADRVSVSEALFDLDILDYRFLLFTDETDDRPSVVYEESDGLSIRKVDGSRPDPATLLPEIRVNETPAPIIGVTEAVSRLNLSDMPFVFFRDSENDHASVLYRRYDGHYGLIVPATPTV